ncbi:aldose 1-epimerase [Singulisphaera acidiphila]|uniref:Galactose mutarotase-like enzyme n=1 Tax=Singulisphaera acidiphila (strain ATCC BAA-1392 / DSM 18658 / VKM B-2454 / MOB10) TaxID=886293 RepID=L0DPV1_SINAD|nr:aldose 1-epimerase [Singulisphaera acidiphila]AGA30716.1 galactose mutarotase-like enzyme [Singulisphaera acidiphila DSM 18658]
MAYRVSTEARGGGKVYTLHDDATGSSASILPSYGFNLFDLRLPVAGEVRPVIVSEPDWADQPRNPARNGVPILFPYPNRVRDATYQFHGKTYRLPVGLAPNAIHGFALDAPWNVIEEKADESGASLTGRYQISWATPKMIENWPTDAILEVRYQLAGRTLTMTITVNNPTAKALPYGFGIHPYFRLPLAPGGAPEKTQVILPAAKEWVLDQFLPTGERREVEARVDFRKGQPRKGLKLDDVLTGLAFENDRCVCRLVDQNLPAEFRLSFDRNFRELVVYTPPREDDVISLEPYTQTTDAINLATKGVDGGLRVLEHGGQDKMTIVMETVG